MRNGDPWSFPRWVIENPACSHIAVLLRHSVPFCQREHSGTIGRGLTQQDCPSTEGNGRQFETREDGPESHAGKASRTSRPEYPYPSENRGGADEYLGYDGNSTEKSARLSVGVVARLAIGDRVAMLQTGDKCGALELESTFGMFRHGHRCRFSQMGFLV